MQPLANAFAMMQLHASPQATLTKGEDSLSVPGAQDRVLDKKGSSNRYLRLKDNKDGALESRDDLLRGRP